MAEKICIREARKSDCKEIRRLIQDLAEYEKMPTAPQISSETLEKDGFETSPPLYGCFVVEDADAVQEDTKLEGYAFYFYTYSTWRGRKLSLNDLYVSEKLRGKQIGSKLFKAVAQKAVADRCALLEFRVKAWNPARSFYESRGCVNVTVSEDWNQYNLDGEALLRAAQS